MLLVLNLEAQNPVVSNSTPTPQPAATAAATPEADLKLLANRIGRLEMAPPKIIISASTTSAGWTTAAIVGSASLIATLIGGGITLLGQHWTGKREESRAVQTAERQLELARQQALLEHSVKIHEFRVKQLEFFYAPMFALLEQSKALYIKHNAELFKATPDKYLNLEEPDEEGYRFKIKGSDGTFYGYRLLDRLPEVRANPEAFALVVQIIEIGKQLTKTISKCSGLASHQIVTTKDGKTKTLVTLLGEYCAHFAILNSVFIRGGTEPYPPGWHKIGYYPRELNKAIEDGYKSIQDAVGRLSSESEHIIQYSENSKKSV